jgi:PPK2 family polyphosphate:nucleotide phosphotransferase
MNFTERFRVKPGQTVHLNEIDPDETAGLKKKKDAKDKLKENRERMADLQYKLYAENRQSLLIVLQAMDAGGKDGTVNHVMAPLNPQGCRVVGFKKPSDEEREHDFLWRIHRAAPRRGEIVIFNRSHYEDVLVVRVHELVDQSVWEKRYERINQFEALLRDHDTRVLKFYLHISADEQLKRFKKRLDRPEKHWKISESDYLERKYWDDYIAAFEDALGRCSTKHAPWFVIPANHKWFRNFAVSQIVTETMEDMNMQLPKPTVDIEQIRRAYHQAQAAREHRHGRPGT